MLRKVKLHGALADRYSLEPIEIDADNPFMVVQGLSCAFGPKFKQDIVNGRFHIIRGEEITAANSLGEDQALFNLGREVNFHIIPVVEGSAAAQKKDDTGGALKIVLGIVIAVVAVVTQQYWALGIAASMVIAGISAVMAPSPVVANSAGQDKPDQRPSYFFTSPVNVNSQGGPVPVVFGTFRCGSVIISGGIDTENIPVPA